LKKVLIEINNYLLDRKIFLCAKPIVIGDNAMCWHGIKREKGTTELIINNEDFEMIREKQYTIKDVWGDLGVKIGKMDIWRSYSLFDYDFYSKGAIELESFLIISFEQLIFTKILKMDNKKDLDDLEIIKDYYFRTFRNNEYVLNALSSYGKYKESPNGIVYLS